MKKFSEQKFHIKLITILIFIPMAIFHTPMIFWNYITSKFRERKTYSKYELWFADCIIVAAEKYADIDYEFQLYESGDWHLLFMQDYDPETACKVILLDQHWL